MLRVRYIVMVVGFGVGVLLCLSPTSPWEAVFAEPSTARYSVEKISLGMQEAEVQAILEGGYDIRNIGSRPPGQNLLWATRKGQVKEPTLDVIFEDGQVSWVKKHWFEERQPSTVSEVLQAQYEVTRDLQAQTAGRNCGVLATRGLGDAGFQTFQTEIRCGDLMLETIRDVEKGDETWIQVNEVLIDSSKPGE